MSRSENVDNESYALRLMRSASQAVPATQQALQGSARIGIEHNYIVLICQYVNMQDEKTFRRFKHISRLRSSCPAGDVALVDARRAAAAAS